jgi:hypothetical protein
MAITPTYSWPLPDDTDLVKDGAEAIRDLGNAIDATVSSVPTGLVHIETRTLTATSLENFNNVFSSTYDNYKVLISGKHTNVSALRFRLRASGTDNSTANSYVEQTFFANGTSVGGSRQTSNFTRVGTYYTTLNNSTNLEFFDPFLAVETSFQASTQNSDSSAAINIHYGTHNQTVSYDGFSLLVETGSITGKISIYGYAKA